MTSRLIAKSISRSHHTKQIETLLAAIGYDGLGCVNYKLNNNKLQLLEINPRFGGSLAPMFSSFLRHFEAIHLIEG